MGASRSNFAGIETLNHILRLSVVGLVLLSAVGDALAKGRSSSGGYSRPSVSSSSSYSRPSVSAPSRSPASSGGYGRPSAPSASTGSAAPASSLSDRSYDRKASSDALRQFRQDRAAPETRTEPSSRPSVSAPSVPSSVPNTGWTWSRPSRPAEPRATGWSQPRPQQAPSGGWQRDPSWNVPSYARTDAAYGSWNPFFMWWMLESLSRPGHAAWFAANRSDPGYTAWRSQADEIAKDNLDLRLKLSDLDERLKAEPVPSPSAQVVPAGVRPEQARVSNPFGTAQTVNAGQATASSAGSFLSFLMILIFCLGFGLIGVLLVRAALRNSARKRDNKMGALSTLRNLAKARVTTADAKPRDPFRLGQVITLDGSMFLLAGAATKVVAPEGVSVGPSAVTVTAVGRLDRDLWRLHLGSEAFLQIQLDAGKPVEARYFSRFDEVTPSSGEEWAFWLDDAEGMIGFPTFETKDGKAYQRVWQAGEARVEPRTITESRTDEAGTRRVKSSAMLYAADTGRSTPSPTREYLLVAAVEDGEDASVLIHAGIDIDPSFLSLI
ncbi:hypothetical protein BSY19_4976 (plasmid) [Bosea sp. RAC05]|nr:hypothetical protein BSY19_4976 [Bosea sp. RAC05]